MTAALRRKHDFVAFLFKPVAAKDKAQLFVVRIEVVNGNLVVQFTQKEHDASQHEIADLRGVFNGSHAFG